MTRRQIDASRERRLWFVQVVLPVLGIGGWVYANNKATIDDKINEIKCKVKNKFKK